MTVVPAVPLHAMVSSASVAVSVRYFGDSGACSAPWCPNLYAQSSPQL